MSKALANIDYYLGDYGKTIRIATQSKEWVIMLKEEIEELFNGNLQSVDLCKMPHINCSDSISSLDLIKVKENPKSRFFFGLIPKQRVILEQEHGKNIFRWLQNVEEIETLLALIDSLICAKNPGHQYLVDDGYYTIELSYNED